MAQEGSAGFPPVRQVAMTIARTGETRTYDQAELTIDGEALLIGLVESVAERLVEHNFPWQLLADLFESDKKPIDWSKASEILNAVKSVAPEVVVESALIFFGIFPTLEDGSRNPGYEEDKSFVRRSINFTRWVGLVQIFAEQNDYQRLAAPFGQALAAGAQVGRPKPEPAAS